MDKGIDINRLKQAVANAIKIHPILFTRIERGAGTEAFLLPAKEKCEIPEIPVIEVTEEEIPALRERLARELADPHTYPFFEFRIYRTESRLFLFHKVPHIISDGESLNILFSDIADAYAGRKLKPEGISLFGICDELNQMIESPLYAQIVSYYKKLLQGLKKWTAIPEDPTGLPAGQDVVVKTLSASAKQIASVKRTYGYLVNTGICRLDVRPSRTLAAFFRQIQNQVFDAMSCQIFPLEEMVGMYPGLMDYNYLYQIQHPELEMDGKKARLHSLSVRDDCKEGMVVQKSVEEDMESSAVCDDGLFKLLTQVYETDAVIYELTYKINRYSRKRIEEMAEDVDRILLRIAGDDVERITIGDVCV